MNKNKLKPLGLALVAGLSLSLSAPAPVVGRETVAPVLVDPGQVDSAHRYTEPKFFCDGDNLIRTGTVFYETGFRVGEPGMPSAPQMIGKIETRVVGSCDKTGPVSVVEAMEGGYR